jgi:hypothetical protein
MAKVKVKVAIEGDSYTDISQSIIITSSDFVEVEETANIAEKIGSRLLVVAEAKDAKPKTDKTPEK